MKVAACYRRRVTTHGFTQEQRGQTLEWPLLLGISGLMFAVSGAAYKVMSLLLQRRVPVEDAYAAPLWWLTGIGLFVSGWLFVHAILLLLRRPWGRVGMLIYAVAAILLTFPAAWVRLARADDWLALQQAQSDDVPRWAGEFGVVIHLLFAAVALVYPTLLLYHLTRPRVKRAFRDARG